MAPSSTRAVFKASKSLADHRQPEPPSFSESLSSAASAPVCARAIAPEATPPSRLRHLPTSVGLSAKWFDSPIAAATHIPPRQTPKTRKTNFMELLHHKDVRVETLNPTGYFGSNCAFAFNHFFAQSDADMRRVASGGTLASSGNRPAACCLLANVFLFCKDEACRYVNAL